MEIKAANKKYFCVAWLNGLNIIQYEVPLEFQIYTKFKKLCYLPNISNKKMISFYILWVFWASNSNDTTPKTSESWRPLFLCWYDSVHRSLFACNFIKIHRYLHMNTRTFLLTSASRYNIPRGGPDQRQKRDIWNQLVFYSIPRKIFR